MVFNEIWTKQWHGSLGGNMDTALKRDVTVILYSVLPLSLQVITDTLRSLSASLPTHMSFPPYHGPVLDTLSPVTADDVRKVLISSPPKSSNMDIIPTSLILRCQAVFSDIIVHLANLSFSEGRFPAIFKQASVTPLLKGHSLDVSSLQLQTNLQFKFYFKGT